MSNPLYRLTVIRRKLADAIHREQTKSAPSPIRLLRLKTLNLALKERIAGLMLRPVPA